MDDVTAGVRVFGQRFEPKEFRILRRFLQFRLHIQQTHSRSEANSVQMHSVKIIKLRKDLRVLLLVLISSDIRVSLPWNYSFYCKSWSLMSHLEHYNSYVFVSLSISISTYNERQGECQLFYA